MGLVEQPQFGPPGDEYSERDTATLASRQSRHPLIGQAAVESEEVDGRRDLGVGRPTGARPETHVLGDGQLVVQAVGVGEQTDPATHLAAVGSQVATGDDGLTAHHRQQAGAGTQNGRLTGAVRAAEEHDLPALDGQIGAREGRETPEDDDDVAQAHD